MNQALLCLAVLLLPVAAHAHGISPAIKGFYAGGAMVLLGPEDVLQLVALSAFAAIHKPDRAGWVAEALVAGLALGCLDLFASVPPWANAASLLVVGSLLVAGVRLPVVALCGLAAGIGTLHGAHAGAEMVAVSDKLTVAVGLGVTGYVFMVVCVATLVWLSQQVKQVRMVAFRAFGSWVVAIALMLGAFELVGQ